MPVSFVTKVLKEVENEKSNLSPEELNQMHTEIKDMREQLDRLEAILVMEQMERQESDQEEEQSEKRDAFGFKQKNKPQKKRDAYGRVIRKPWLYKN